MKPSFSFDVAKEGIFPAETGLNLKQPEADCPNTEEHFEAIENELFFLAASPAMQKIRNQAVHVARVDIPVLILGESGAGKEVLARFIHKLSTRSRKPMVKVNCAALPHELLESELFGYEPGAFTGATRPKPGTFELCDKGIVMLDEIGEMSPVLQAKLLHVLQDGKFSRLGGRYTISADFRVLAATNINVQEAIGNKSFREDLYYRLNAFTIHVPPLRERREEIPILLRHFMTRFAVKYARPPLPLSATLIETATKYSWPGNLRELENFVKRYLILGEEQQAIAELQAAAPAAPAPAPAPAAAAVEAPRDLKSLVRDVKAEAEGEAIARALEQCRGVRKEAARVLGISYKALLYKMRACGLDR